MKRVMGFFLIGLYVAGMVPETVGIAEGKPAHFEADLVWTILMLVLAGIFLFWGYLSKENEPHYELS